MTGIRDSFALVALNLQLADDALIDAAKGMRETREILQGLAVWVQGLKAAVEAE